MSAYVLVRITVLDADKLKTYQDFAPVVIEKYNGKLLARGGKLVPLEGDEDNRRVVIVEFPSLERAKEFYYSPEYAEAIELRKGAADFEMIAVDGLN